MMSCAAPTATSDHLMRSACISKRPLLLGGPSSSLSAQQRAASKPSPGLSEMLRTKLTLGARVLRVGGVQRMYRRTFVENGVVLEGERVLKASQCSLWTTSGPVEGLLFVSTARVAFCSHRPIRFESSQGELVGRSYYKVTIPVGKIARAAKKESAGRVKMDKYLKVVTSDGFEFWFMGIVGLNKTFKSLQQLVLSQMS